MIRIVNFSSFCDSFSGSYEKNFSYEGKRALFDYLEEYEESTGESVELDPIALCCEYSEYASADEAASNYFEYEGMTFDDEGGELETADEVEKKALAFLNDRTQVIEFDGGVIIAQF